MAKAADDVLRELIERCKVLQVEHANEAETRLEVINTVLESVLGWPRQQFNPETLAPGANGTRQREWLDYHLTPQDGAALVVEAKRIGTTFAFAKVKKQQRHYKLQTLRTSHGAPMAAVLAQASEYCISTGTFAFAVTNGVQWIAGVSAWPRVPVDKLEAVVFHDLQDILTNLPDFVDLLSPDGLAAGILSRRARL